MAVIIRNMEMPKCCNDCPFYDISDYYDYCIAAQKTLDDFEMHYRGDFDDDISSEQRSSVCPLFPLDYDLLERKLDDGR